MSDPLTDRDSSIEHHTDASNRRKRLVKFESSRQPKCTTTITAVYQKLLVTRTCLLYVCTGMHHDVAATLRTANQRNLMISPDRGLFSWTAARSLSQRHLTRTVFAMQFILNRLHLRSRDTPPRVNVLILIRRGRARTLLTRREVVGVSDDPE
jgi:hypothetical protein